MASEKVTLVSDAYTELPVTGTSITVALPMIYATGSKYRILCVIDSAGSMGLSFDQAEEVAIPLFSGDGLNEGIAMLAGLPVPSGESLWARWDGPDVSDKYIIRL